VTDQDAQETETKPSCVIKEMLSFFQEPVCVADRQETWVGWDAWVADAPSARPDDGEG